jgi:hypothetical protein
MKIMENFTFECVDWKSIYGCAMSTYNEDVIDLMMKLYDDIA